MKPLSILYLGDHAGTSGHRAAALMRLGHSVSLLDPVAFLPKTRLSEMWTWHTGALFLEGHVRTHVLENIPARQFDLVYVDCGHLVGPSLIQDLRARFGTVVNYNLDDPYGRRDGKRWRVYLKAVPFYDLIVVVRDCNVSEAFAAGAQRVLRVFRSADEIAHKPRQVSDQDDRIWSSEVAFVGTWMPERGPFMARLVELGVPVSIYGDHWEKAREWDVLKSYWRGPGLTDADNYAKAIQCAKINLGLLSKGNRDDSTQRSFEIPHLGGVLCAERTAEHLALYEEDREAIFWDTPDECARKCAHVLKDHELRKRIGSKGRQRCLRNRTTNEMVLSELLHALDDSAVNGTFQNARVADSLRHKAGNPNFTRAVSCGTNRRSTL
jgi:spore maturation protein CgeB